MSITTPVDELQPRIEAVRSRKPPLHVALIADGQSSNETGESTLDLLFGQLGIKHLTLAMGSEKAACDFMNKALGALESHEVRLTFWGQHPTQEPASQALFARAQTATRNFNRHQLRVAIACDGRQEILEAAKRYIAAKAAAQLNGKPLSAEVFQKYLGLAHVPDPDLLIRTGGSRQIPNALLWQMAYSEFWISEKSWRDFNTHDWLLALEAYQRRQRRFGGLQKIPA